MHGRACEERKRGRHMWTAPLRAPASVKAITSSATAASSLLFLSSSPDSFFKDGRKISIGDCALFKPSQNCPPFIGIIRSVTSVKENQLNLGVNWLYRPTEVKLGKGILLDALPNEIFYSFHKDEIPAASLLHLCKVTFLPKGVELPSGICSFVCWRVYDITHKCLWWLTEQDYIDEHQEEVDQLLCKTRFEMHATVQQGGRSPKTMNGPTSTSQLKASSDSVQNTGSSFPSQAKGKKRERADQGFEPVKRERAARVEDADSVYSKLESTLRSEIVKITEKGGLVDSDGVEKLVQLMLPERSGRKIDLASRLMLAGVVAATDKFDCLSRFVQLRGLPVLDEWLQEVHKGKVGDSNSPKDGDRSTEEFLLVLLRALDKLPVNLHALQTCNIGKSVNHLRSHKNVEIQRKARSLVDTWKKRVEAEMDAKSSSGQGVSWPGRRLAEPSHGSPKTSVSHPHSSKSSSIRLVQGENNVKSASPSPGSTRSALSPSSGCMNMKEGQQKNSGGVSGSDVPPTSVRDEKSSSSSPSHNNSQSCSSDHAKAGGVSVKDDPRCPTTGSLSVNKSSGGSSRHRRSVNGLQGSASSVGHRETGSVRNSSLSKNNSTSEKVSQSDSTCEKTHEVQATEGNAHKLIVKIPNQGYSPAETTATATIEDTAVVNSRTSSPVICAKNDQVDQNLKEEKTCTHKAIISSDVHDESWQSNDAKIELPGSDEGGGSTSIPSEERCWTVDDAKKMAEVPKASVPDVPKASLPQCMNELKPEKSHENPFSSINALIESCVQYSDANTPVAAGDDIGMNLLASVATGEISKSDMISPNGSSQTNENSCEGNDSKQNLSSDGLAQTLPSDGAKFENEKQDFVSGNACPKEADTKADFNPISVTDRKLDSSPLKQPVNQCLESIGWSRDAEKTSSAMSCANDINKHVDGDMIKESNEIKDDGVLADDASDMKQKLSADIRVGDSGVTVGGEVPYSQPFSESDKSTQDEPKPPIRKSSSELVRGTEHSSLRLGSGKCLVSANVDELKAKKADEMETGSHHDAIKGQKIEGESSSSGNQVGAGLVSYLTNYKVEHVGENLDGNEDNEQQSGVHSPTVSSSLTVKDRGKQCAKGRESRSNIAVAEVADESTSLAGDASSSSAADRDTKVEFDLNEGFSGDDGRNGDLGNLTGAGISTPVQFPLPIPASITVATAAKGPFVPPEDLLRNKGVHGWKGSAATSAFRPAEPRNSLERPLATNNAAQVDVNTRRQSRPPLDIDLNIPDERVLEDFTSRTSGQTSVCDITNNSLHDLKMGSASTRSAGGLDLDLNRVDETTDLGNYTTNSHKLDSTFQPSKQVSSGRMTDEAGGRRDFDLNNGHMIGDVNLEPSILFGQHAARSSLPSQPSLPGMQVNGANMGNLSSWFAAASYSATVPPTVMPDRDLPFPMVASSGPSRLLGSTTASSSFSPDLYRGPVLTSSPAVPFQSTSPFQYPVFSFGAGFPLSSATFSGGSATYLESSSAGPRLTFPPANSQLLGPAIAVPSNYPRPYVVNLTDGNNSGGASRKWLRQELDLNTGPAVPDAEGRSETSSRAPSRPLSASSTQTRMEEQARIFQMPGGVVKRKEPEGGWDGYKQQPSWH
ncbi:PREDICTED: uncharacterized protein LOC104808305 [Tarenaya hassleriana]|uniref:uncharacterized protein LOC104808305 n=1 Tax=Tarenaya hassleriana TaxID=28532 RepID=UPI00053C5A77|nr:PREDICTED: uncharacterized protein LOC104808305 [Tarenaya hassleriana]